MAITFKWSIQKLRVVPQLEDKTNVVVQADWLCAAINDEGIIQAAASGTKQLTIEKFFTPFEELTEAQVLSWCHYPETITETDREGNVTTTTKNLKAEAEAQVTGQIERQLQKDATEPALPWLTKA